MTNKEIIKNINLFNDNTDNNTDTDTDIDNNQAIITEIYAGKDIDYNTININNDDINNDDINNDDINNDDINNDDINNDDINANSKILNGKVYKIINLLINEPCYIGQTIVSIQHRFNEHCNLSNNQNTSYLINTYGRQYFKIELIQDNINTRNELDIIEKENIINYLKQYDLVNKVVYKNYEKTSITVQCIETGEIFSSINLAAKRYNININNISRAIQYGYVAGKDDNNNDLHWKRLNNDNTYQKRIRDEYIIYIIEQKFKISNNTDINTDTNTNIDTDISINEKSTDQIISTNHKFKSNAFCIQCIETLEIFSSMNKAAKNYNINSNLVFKSIKYGYAAGIDQNGNKLHWKKITNEQYSNILKQQKYNENQYIWKPIYVQQTRKKIWNNQLEFHKNNENSPLYKILNNNDINDFRLIPVQESSLTIIKENIKKFINIKSLNDAIEKEKQLISLLISNSYQLYNFYNNPHYSINNDDTIVIDIDEIMKNYNNRHKKLEQEVLYNNQQVDLQEPVKQLCLQCIETREIFTDVNEILKRYNIDLRAVMNSLIHGRAAGKINSQNQEIPIHWREYNINIPEIGDNKSYQLYIVEQKIQNINKNNKKDKIKIQCLETNEIFEDLQEAAQKYHTTTNELHRASKYGYAAGYYENNNSLYKNNENIQLHSQSEVTKLHWINLNELLYDLRENKDSNFIWVPICIICDQAIIANYVPEQKNMQMLLNKWKNNTECCIYNLLNQLPLDNFRIANLKRYKFILNQWPENNNIIINETIPLNINEDIYYYFIQKLNNKDIIKDVIEQAQINLSQYYNLYNVQLTSQDLIGNGLARKSIDIIMWKLIKDNLYMQSDVVYKDIENNKIFLNLIAISRYYRISIQKIKSILDTKQSINIYSTRKIQLISININELHDDTIIYATAYKVLKLEMGSKTIYAATYRSYKEYITGLHRKDSAGINNIINNINDYNCSIIKAHIYFQEEAEALRDQLLNKKPNVFRCKLPVRCINTGEKFSSIEEACNRYKYKNEAGIVRVCRHYQEYTTDPNTGEKLKWEFITNDNINNQKNIQKNINNIKNNNYTVFLVYYKNKLITIASSTRFINDKISMRYKRLVICKLKYNNLNLKNLLCDAKVDDITFKICKNELTRIEAQQMIKKLKAQYINEIIA